MSRNILSGRIPISRSKGLIYNSAFDLYPSTITAATTNVPRWVDGTAAGSTAKLGYGWGTIALSNASATFDMSIYRTNPASMKLSTTTTAGTITVASYRINSPTASSVYEMLKIKPSTVYTLSGYIRTNNVPTNGAYIEFRTYDSAFGSSTTYTSNKLSGTDSSWRPVSVTFTTGSTAAWGGIFLRNNVAGNICDVWFDDLSLVPQLNGRVTATGRVTA